MNVQNVVARLFADPAFSGGVFELLFIDPFVSAHEMHSHF